MNPLPAVEVEDAVGTEADPSEAPELGRARAAAAVGVGRLGWGLLGLAAARALPPTLVAVAERWEWEGLEPGVWLWWTATAPEDPKVLALAVAWPAVLGLALRVWRWPDLARAALLTALALAVDSAVGLGIGLATTAGLPVLGGSRALPPLASWPGAIGASLAAGLILLALFVAWNAWRVPRPAPAAVDLGDRRRASTGRQAAILAGGLAAMLTASPLASAYVEMLLLWPTTRRLVLRAETTRARPARPMTAAEGSALAVSHRLATAAELASTGRYAEARREFLAVMATAEGLARDSSANLRPRYRSTGAQAANNLAWMLATCPDPTARDPAEAVARAEEAVALIPADGNSWNTLGIARYRAGDPPGARAALERSLELRKGGDAFDWYFLALLEADAGRPETARRWYDQAVAWAGQHRPFDDELPRFRAEAAVRLGLPVPPTPIPSIGSGYGLRRPGFLPE